MRTPYMVILLALLINVSKAQYAISGDPQGGTPMKAVSYVTLKGLPYLLPDWAKGEVREDNGVVYKNLLLQYDMIQDKLAYIDRTGFMMEFSKPVAYFEVFDSAVFAVRKFKRAENTGYYEILADGVTSLYKKTTKSIVDDSNFGTANTAKVVLQSVAYYVGSFERMQKIKLTKSSISSVFGNKQGFNAYVESEKINFKNEKDLIKLFNHFNTGS